jgi:hypothetical protein
VEEHQTLHLGASGNPFQAGPGRADQPADRILRLEHITRGVSRALGNCSPGNILLELAWKMDRSNVDALETEKAQLATQVAAMMR